MQTGELVSSPVMTSASRILVNGIERSGVSWEVSRELPGDLPVQVTASSGIVQATGIIIFTMHESASSGALNPFNASTGWIPKPGDRVQIYAGDGESEWQQIEGIIDTPSGSVSEGFQATLIDAYDKLSAPFKHEPLLRIMPPLAMGEPRRGVGLSTPYYINAALRRAGFFSTPPVEYEPALSVPCQGSMWPERGTFESGAGYTTGKSHADSHGAPWGWSASNFSIKYAPRVSMLASSPTQATVMVSPDHSGNFTMNINYGPSRVALYVYANRNVAVYLGSTLLTSLQMANSTIVSVLIRGGVLLVKNGDGASVSVPVSMPSGSMSSIQLLGDAGARVAGIQVSHPNTSARELSSLSWTPSAVMDLSSTTLLGLMDAGPAIQDTTCAEVLQQISESTLTAMWIDERGIFRVTPSPVFRSRTPVRTVTTLDDVLSLDWDSSILGSRSHVRVKGRQPAIKTGRWCNTVVYRGNGSSLESEDTDEQIIGPDADKDWIMVDESLTVLRTGNWSQYNSNWQTVSGAFYSTTGDEISDAGLTTDISMQKISVSKYKITHQAGVLPAGVTANISTSPTASALWPRNRDKDLPRINAMGEVTWADVEVIPTGAGGVGPELEHDARFWVNRRDSTEILDRIGGYIQSQTAVPKATIPGMEIVPDPRLQLGDVIRIESKSLMGITLDALIVGMQIGGSNGALSQSLSVRIIRSSTTFQTYAAFQEAIPGTSVTYQQWQVLGPVPETYQQINLA